MKNEKLTIQIFFLILGFGFGCGVISVIAFLLIGGKIKEINIGPAVFEIPEGNSDSDGEENEHQKTPVIDNTVFITQQSTATLGQPSTPEFFDDFDDGLDSLWIGQTENWLTSEGYGIANECGKILIGNADWNNYSISFDVKGYFLHTFSLILASTESEAIFIKFAYKTTESSRVYIVKSDENDREVSNSYRKLETSEGINKIKAEVRGNNLLVFFNENQIYDMTFPKTLDGYVGFDACSGGNPIDNFKVSPLE